MVTAITEGRTRGRRSRLPYLLTNAPEGVFRSTMNDQVVRLLGVVAIGVAALLAVALLHLVLTRIGRNAPLIADLARIAHRATQVTAVLFGLYLGTHLLDPADEWVRIARHTLLIVLLASAAWLITELLFVIEEAALARYRTDVQDNLRARKVHTQVRLVRRVTAVVVAVIAIGAMLITFPRARYFGTSILASAGIVGVVTALAAQAVLGNILAGLQLAFGGALRLEDVVVVENEWGRIQEMTLTYVVVHIWDDRRLILPTSYFTTRPFENWTRQEAALLGSVEIDTDWTVPVGEMREELRAWLSRSDLWDGRVSVLQVIEATGSQLRLRALVSAADAPRLWDLRCEVREHMIDWLRRHHPEALPRVRADLGPLPEEEWTPPDVKRRRVDTRDSRAFGGDLASWLRGETFTGPDQRQDHEPPGHGAGSPFGEGSPSVHVAHDDTLRLDGSAAGPGRTGSAAGRGGSDRFDQGGSGPPDAEHDSGSGSDSRVGRRGEGP